MNKTDTATLASNFGSLKALAKASREELALCPGLGGKKVERIFSALHAPFPGAKKKMAAFQIDGIKVGKTPMSAPLGNLTDPEDSGGEVDE